MVPDPDNVPAKSPVNPTGAARCRTRPACSGRRRSAGRGERARADVDAGAPANADGTLNLVHYAAWLVKEIGRGD